MMDERQTTATQHDLVSVTFANKHAILSGIILMAGVRHVDNSEFGTNKAEQCCEHGLTSVFDG